MSLPFLTAHWRNLILLNFEVDPAILVPLLPPGTELDLFENKALMSVVAFNFEENKLLGKIPTVPVTHFEELNLRFYVRRKVGDAVRRGVVFVKEVVPSALIAGTARVLYNEPYEARPMQHDFSRFNDQAGGTLSYTTRLGLEDVTVSATTSGDLQQLAPGSVQEFILEHYWGYTKRDDGSVSEYRVEHEPWRYWDTNSTTINGDVGKLYPSSFHTFLRAAPHSTFVAHGSPVAVYGYQRFHATYNTQAFPNKNVHGYVLYDGACGFCSWWVPKIEHQLAHASFGIAPLQVSWVRDSIPLSEEELTRDLRILLRDGTLLSGADAYIYAMRRMRGVRLLGILLSLPGLRWLTWQAYRLFNRNRFVISRACKLSPEIRSNGGET